MSGTAAFEFLDEHGFRCGAHRGAAEKEIYECRQRAAAERSGQVKEAAVSDLGVSERDLSEI